LPLGGGAVDVPLSSLPQPVSVASTRAVAAQQMVENLIRCSCDYFPATGLLVACLAMTGLRRLT